MTRSGDEAQLMTGVTGDLAGTELGLTPSLTKNAGVPTTDQPQKGKDFTSDQEVRWCPGCGDYVILNTIRNFLPELGLRRETSCSSAVSDAPAGSPITWKPTAFIRFTAARPR